MTVGKKTVKVESYSEVLQVLKTHFQRSTTTTTKSKSTSSTKSSSSSFSSASQELRLSDVDEVIRQNVSSGRSPKQGVTRALVEQVLGYRCEQPNYCNTHNRRYTSKLCPNTCVRNRIWVVPNLAYSNSTNHLCIVKENEKKNIIKVLIPPTNLQNL